MRKASKIVLLIWDILLIPLIVFVITDATGLAERLLNTVTYLLIGLSQFLIPQIITLGLIVACFAFRGHDTTNPKREIAHITVLSVIGVLGAVCAFVALVMMSAGEMGVPLP